MKNFKYLSQRPLTVGFVLYWMIFWLFNGLDKFLNRSTVGGFTWFGKDRNWQFGVYLENMGLSLDFVPAILTFAGLWELLVAVIFFSTLNVMIVAGKREEASTDRFYTFGLFVSALTFIAFCAFDVVVGDRAELLEHSTYMVVVAVSFIGLVAENVARRQAVVGQN